MEDFGDILLPLIGEVKASDVPAPEEYNYWQARKQRIFYIDYEILEDYALVELSKVILQMNMAERDIPNEELKPIYIFVHSFGGDLSQTFAFCDLLVSSRIPIVTVTLGVAESAGFLIFLAGHKRYCFKHSEFMVHSGSAGFQGTAEQIEQAQKNYKKQLNEMKDYILSRTDIDEKTFNKNRSKDWYLTLDEVAKYKIVDQVIESITDIWS